MCQYIVCFLFFSYNFLHARWGLPEAMCLHEGNFPRVLLISGAPLFSRVYHLLLYIYVESYPQSIETHEKVHD